MVLEIEPEQLSPSASIFLNFMRSLAAFLVVIGHARFFAYRDEALPWPLGTVLGLGHEAVVIFFVLSGFLIGREAFVVWLYDKNAPAQYAIDRFTRIYTVLVPALIVTAILDGFSGSRLTVTNFIGNLFALQDFYVQPYGSNGPLWSLSYELWCYALFPLILIAIVGRRSTAILAAAVLIGATCALGTEFIKNGCFWLLGAAAWFPQRRWLPTPVLAALLALVLLLFPLLPAGMPRGTGTAYLFAIAMLTAALLNAYRHGARFPVRLAKPCAAIAAFSFTLYLFHFPLMAAVMRHYPSSGAGCAVSLVVLAYVFSFVCYFAFERNYRKLRTLLT